MVGIYVIRNKINGKMYIGQSVDIKRRKCEHFKNLNYGVHENKLLMDEYLKYSKENFIIL